MVLRGRFTRLHHIPDHERWDSVICMQTWYEAAIYAYSFPGFSPTRHRSWRREPWKWGCSCDESRSLKQIRRRRQQQRQKTIGLMSKTKALHVHQDFSTFLWRPLHDYDVKPPNATFYGGRGHTTTNFPFSIWTWIKPLTIHLQEKSPTFDELSGSKWTR